MPRRIAAVLLAAILISLGGGTAAQADSGWVKCKRTHDHYVKWRTSFDMIDEPTVQYIQYYLERKVRAVDRACDRNARWIARVLALRAQPEQQLPAREHAPVPPVDLSANQALGKSMNAARGWAQYWPDLYQLWSIESGWSNTAYNEGSGAWGIPQAVPYSKIPKAGQPTWAGGRADPGTQIGWGLGYIGGRYGTPRAALAHVRAYGWY